ncbi:methanobactin export MATE transporter MbnM [Rubrivivax albus]|uniref:Di-heme enzyme n=1 Tax=Rubrivivax albus TaxID=2499835 RepID=A0A3S2U2U6_9BURK|nr:methanobactin export MATE transporter MbnM [Rubrivivax albus]RVT51422.1 di-heme enzyme [Rubrivivax albus]
MRMVACLVLATGVFAGTALLATGCGGGGTTLVEPTPAAGGTEGDWRWSLPAYYPAPKVPADNPMTTAKVELGRFLFHDKRLSGNGSQACAGCHLQALAFSDGRAQARGSTGAVHPRSAQHLSNVVFNATLTWANPSLVTLEQQMLTPLFGDDPVEMGVNDANRDAVLQRLRDDADYPARFAAAFPGVAEPIGWPQVIQAIASFQRALVSADSRYDRWLQGRGTLSTSETRGMNLFFGEKAECFHCHGSFNFNDQIVHASSRIVETPFHNTGLYNLGGSGAFPEPNRGVFELSAKAADMGAFRAPSLRNVEVTAPYMHDGSVATLEDVLRHYAAGGRVIASGPYAGDGRANPYKSDLVTRIDLDDQEQADIVAFLKTLTDSGFLSDARFSDPFATRTTATAKGDGHAR